MQKEAKRSEKLAVNRPARLRTLGTLELRQGDDGYQITLIGEGRRRRMVIAPGETAAVLRDLETVIKVNRARQ